jgi:hypothetical protein
LVDEKDVITWKGLSKRQYTSQGHFLLAIEQLHQNARVYNIGCEVLNKAYDPAGTEPKVIKKGPGKLACPDVAHLVGVFKQRVLQYLSSPEVAEEVCACTEALPFAVPSGSLNC